VSTQGLLGWEDLQRELPTIVGRLNEDQSLAVGAAVNPLYALEELGYAIDPEQRVEIEDRLRFRPRHAARLRRLRREIAKAAGRTFDPAADDEVLAVLSELDVLPARGAATKRDARKTARRAVVTEATPEPTPAVLRKDELAELLESLRDRHPVIEPLTEFRRIELSEPRLAPRELYEQVRRGERATPATSVRAVLKARQR
jgi:hypothetical protein